MLPGPPPVSESRCDIEARDGPVSEDREAFELLARTSAAAIGIDRGTRVRYWSSGAESLLGWRAASVVGRTCADVLAAKDCLEGPYCGPACPIYTAAISEGNMRPVLLRIRSRSDPSLLVRVRSLALPAPGPGIRLLVHLVDSVREKEVERLVLELRSAMDRPIDERRALPLPDANPLSARERQILLLLSEGFATLNIAMRLNLSHTTTRNHVANILRKMEVHHQGEAIAVAFRKGWIT